jgi:hypothetical protein
MKTLTSISTTRREMRNAGEWHSGHFAENVEKPAPRSGAKVSTKRLLIVMIDLSPLFIGIGDREAVAAIRRAPPCTNYGALIRYKPAYRVPDNPQAESAASAVLF